MQRYTCIKINKIMKNVLFLFALLVAGSAFAHGPVKVNLGESSVNWKAAKVTGEHMGYVNLQSANLDIQDGVLKGGDFTADMTSITVTDLEGEWKQKLEGHLKSDDFFGVENHGTASFKITSANASGNNSYNVTGDLTIKGITHPVSFVATLADNKATANIKVDRTKYDIKYGSGSFFDGLGDKMIYDAFDLTVSLAY